MWFPALEGMRGHPGSLRTELGAESPGESDASILVTLFPDAEWRLAGKARLQTIST